MLVLDIIQIDKRFIVIKYLIIFKILVSSVYVKKLFMKQNQE